MRRLRDLLLLLPLFAVLLYFQWQYKGYVKDDAFISLRYARNVAEGLGFVFNPGDRLEGYTNFLWIVFEVPAYWLGIDPLNWAKVLASFFGHVGIVVTFALGRFWGGERATPFAWLGAAMFATSPSVILWSQGGLEPTFMAVAASGGTLFAMKVLVSDDDAPTLRRDSLLAALLLTCAALCRPDAHAVVLIAGALAAVDCLRRRTLRRVWLRVGGLILAVLVPYHAWRIWYFGDHLPNTFYVKAAAGPEVMKRGLGLAEELVTFTTNAGLFPLAALGLLVVGFAALRRIELPGGKITRLWALGLCAFFVAYMIKIGRDEMKWFRLFLPVFPLLCALAADTVSQLVRPIRWKPTVVAWVAAVLLAGGGASVSLSYADSKSDWHDNYRRWSAKSFMAMGAYVQEHSEPGDVIAFQDMGAAPFAGGDLEWVDTIGILNRFVAHELADIKLNPFMRSEKRSQPGGSEQIRAFDRTVRNYVLDQEPEWLAFVAYIPKRSRVAFNKEIKKLRRGDSDDLSAKFLRRIQGNSHVHGITRDPRFKADYEYERYWKRNMGYWVVLYRNKNHEG